MVFSAKVSMGVAFSSYRTDEPVRDNEQTNGQTVKTRNAVYRDKQYTVFQKNGHPFYFFHNSLKWRSIYTKFLPDVAEEMLIQNIWTKYGC